MLIDESWRHAKPQNSGGKIELEEAIDVPIIRVLRLIPLLSLCSPNRSFSPMAESGSKSTLRHTMSQLTMHVIIIPCLAGQPSIFASNIGCQTGQKTQTQASYGRHAPPGSRDEITSPGHRSSFHVSVPPGGARTSQAVRAQPDRQRQRQPHGFCLSKRLSPHRISDRPGR